MNKIQQIFKRHRLFLIILALTWGVFFSFLFIKMIEFEPTGLYVGHQNVWSDWALHTGIANTFAFKDPSLWFAYHPLYAGGQFTYPFLTDAVSGMLMRAGVSLPLSFIIPSIVFCLILLVAMYFLFYLLTRSKRQAYVAICIYFMSAGLGFISYFSDVLSDPSWARLLYPMKDYSSAGQFDWYAGNVIVGLVLPQRSFLIGITIGMCALLGLVYVMRRHSLPLKTRRILLLTSGVLAGILPIAHAHSFIAVLVIAGLICFWHWRRWRELLWYFIPAAIISSILYLTFIHGGIENESFFRFYPGWAMKKGSGLWGWAGMWGLIWGLSLPIALISLSMLWKRFDRSGRIFFLACLFIFAIGNLWLFQPVRWDNTKLFWWAYFGFAVLAAALLGWLWRRRWFGLGKFLSIVFFISLTLTGGVEILRLAQIDKHRHMITNTDDIQLGLQIRAETDPLAIFLTSPSHNHFIMMWAARSIYMGYTAWVWNFGFNHVQRERDLPLMYQGGVRAESLLREYNISYVVIGPGELGDQRANEEYFRLKFPLAFSDQNYRIYDIRSLLH